MATMPSSLELVPARYSLKTDSQIASARQYINEHLQPGAFPLTHSTSTTLSRALKNSLKQRVVTDDMPKPSQLLSLDGRP
ncbi:hypothetical protein DPMN_083378 [Dreissena polymorpha]|uniref:Uncharacterized protein n=1 Tax=Dreissena polymorpha TaxID=45954 RepID=A0A9D4BIE0_DREPO|nr:hypothetical protein DPMN_083378 [Dreissena polymorpha]